MNHPDAMEHPEDLLAEYVDGTLPQAERGAVDEHLAVCERCRGEVGIAAQATVSLRSLQDEPVPVAVTGPIVARVEGEQRRRQDARTRVLRWAVGLAAAAAVFGVFLVARPPGGDEQADRASVAGGLGAEASAVPAAPEPDAFGPGALEKQDVDYDPEVLQRLAADTVAAVKGEARAPQASPVLAPEDTEAALTCLLQGAQVGADDTIVRLIEARYEGTPAFLGMFLQGPTAGPPDKVVIWVVAREDCRLLSYTQGRV